jgi:hypothetical protein
MDVLLSLPIVSYFFSTSLTSWSTSLNLLFFYMTWSTLVLSYSPLRIELIGITAVRTVLWLIPSLVFLLFDTLVPSLAESIKHTGASALPPRDVAYLSRTLGLAVFNLVLESALEFGLSLGLTTALDNPIFRTSTTLPLPWQLIKQLALLFAAREVLTYYIHRYILHSSQRFPRVTRLHRQYAHSHRGAPYSLLLGADHPIPFLLHHFVPLYLPAVALRPHILVYFVFVALSTLEETLAMSGYSVIPGIMMGGVTRRCATHYSSSGRGNYGAWGLLDWVHGTSVGRGDVMDDVRDEADKHQVKQRGGSMVQNGIDGLRRSARKGRKARRVSSGSDY